MRFDGSMCSGVLEFFVLSPGGEKRVSALLNWLGSQFCAICFFEDEIVFLCLVVGSIWINCDGMRVLGFVFGDARSWGFKCT